jgi:hypothetical protein
VALAGGVGLVCRDSGDILIRKDLVEQFTPQNCRASYPQATALGGRSRPRDPSPLSLADTHAALFDLPLVERRRAKPLLSAQLGCRQARLLLFAHPNNLRFGETAFPHVVCSFRLRKLYIRLRKLPGGRSRGTYQTLSSLDLVVHFLMAVGALIVAPFD